MEESLLVSKFIEAVKKYGPKTALVDSPDGKTLRRTSFDALMKLSRQVAGYIQTRGIAPHSFITIEMSASVEFMAAEMGVWMARCVAVPMGPAFPEERKKYITNHCDAALNLDAVLMESIGEDAPLADIAAPASTDDALIVYTSGSTGTPKGILHDHMSLSNVIRAFDKHDRNSDDRFAAGIPSYFVAAGSYWGLTFGTEVHILPFEMNKDVARMAEYHRQNGITCAFVSATVLPLYRCTAPTIRVVSTGSDRVVCRELHDYVLDNCYGLTETMGNVINTVITEPTENAPIGLPIRGVEFAILDDDLNPVPQGVEGEICLKGHFCKGYYKEEEMTRQLYRGGWLHTGDIGYVLPDGRIQFVNRKDWMVKVNGQRVEPGEVEAAMRSIDSIGRAVVKGFDGGNGSHYLVGYYSVKNEESTLKNEDIRDVLKQLLPEYMVPSYFVQMKEFPVNANGKIDRKSLKAPVRENLTSEYVAPTNEAESALCDIMAKVMNLSRVGIDDNIMNLGGDSIQMMTVRQLCSESDVKLLQGISIAIIYKGATPRNMVKMLYAEQSSTTHCEKPVLENYPLYRAQKRVFFEPQGGLRSNMPQLYVLDDGVDIDRLSQAIQTAFASHKALFTHFLLDDSGEPRQTMSVEHFDIPIEQLSQEEFEAQKRQLIHPFDLLHDRLFRVRLFEVGENKKHYLFLDVHHIIIDGASFQILFRDIDRAYRALDIEPEDWNMAEMAVEDTSMRQSERYQRAIEWHKEILSQGRCVKGSWPEGNMRITRCPIDVSLGDVRRFCQSQGVTLSALTMAAYILSLGLHTRKKDLSFGTVFSGRDDARIRNSVGLFAHQIWFNGRWNDNMRCDEFIRSIGNSMFEAVSNGIVEDNDIAPFHSGPSRVTFLFQGELLGVPSIDGHSIVRMPVHGAVPTAKDSGLFAHLYVMSELNNLMLTLISVDQWRDEAYIHRLAGRYAQCLRGLMTVTTVGEIVCDVPQEEMF